LEKYVVEDIMLLKYKSDIFFTQSEIKEELIMEAKMKHYIYISDTKVDMLYAQIDKSLLKRFSVDLSIDLKPLGAGVGATIKQAPLEETRISKLRLVVRYIEEHQNVGWIDAPGNYFKGSLPMDWGLALHRSDVANREAPYAIYFIGKTDRTVVGLVGSVRHLIGNVADAPGYMLLLYTPHEILKTLASTTEQLASLNDDNLRIVVYDMLVRSNLRQQRPLEFLAVNYKFSEQERGKLNFLLGSPLYVAFAD
jgi:hypothetical protein